LAITGGYDAAGNLIYYAPRTLAYDAENRMISATATGADNEYFAYDGDGRRVQKTWVPLSGPTKVTTYVYGASGIAAEYTNESAASTGTSWMFTDLLGSVRAVTGDKPSSGSAVITESYDYLPFGRMLSSYDNRSGLSYPATPDSSLSNVESPKFTGQVRDVEIGLDYFEARYFSAAGGRFASVDPVIVSSDRILDPQQINLYAYVRNNPLRFTDPSGMELTLSGNTREATKQLCKIIGGDCDRIKYDKKTNSLNVDLAGIDLEENEGAALLDDVVNSKDHYDLSIGQDVQTLGGKVKLTHVLNLDGNVDDRYTDILHRAKLNTELPAVGIKDQVAVNLNTTMTSTTKLKRAEGWAVVFHELAEAFAKIDHGKQYEAAHQEALDRELKLRDQRPYLKKTNPGAGPGDQESRTIIIRR
jgi:RHS repeat-associated protein